MADAGEIAALFATLGLKVNAGQWQQGTAQIGQTRAAVGRLDGAFTDASGRWRAASGRFLTMGEKMAAGLGGVAPAAKAAGAAAEHAGQQAAHGFDAAGAALKGYLLYLGGHLGYEKLIKSNEEMETSIISLSAVIEGNLGGSYQAANAQAKDLYAGWQKFSTQTPVQTSALLEFGKNIAAATFAAGGKVKDLQELTQQGVIAAQVLAGNRGAGYASLEITEMLMGNVSNRMMMARQILGFVKMTEEQFRELDAAGRLKTVKQALNSGAFKDAATAFSSSFIGVTSTMWDKINIKLREIGEPLFERLKGAVAQFNEWLDAHGPDIERWGKIISDVLVSAFDTLSTAMSYVLDYGGQVIDWIGQFVDSSELLKSALTAIGIVLAVFAVQSAIAFATNPITLIIVGITALVYAIRWLMQHPEKVRKAFHDAWEAIKKAAQSVWEFITEGFSGAFIAISMLPVVGQLIWLVRMLSSLAGLTHYKGGEMLQDSTQMSSEDFRAKYPEAGKDNVPFENLKRLQRGEQPVLSAPAGPASSGPVAYNVSVGDINIHSPNADPVAVGDQVRKVFHEELGNTLRKATDAYG